jgi:very-short-patch-repair endonuclease
VFPAEVRAAGLARVIADAYGRRSAAVLIEVPAGLSPAGEVALVGAAEWLADRGRFTVWLAGAPLLAMDRIRKVAVTLPAPLVRLAAMAAPRDEPSDHEPRPIVSFPPLAGSPRSDSAAEQALERALSPHMWAEGREWNRTYEATDLAREYRLDLCWSKERVVVEVDGPDHRQRFKWADDRARDVHLQMYGYQVLRFPNEEVLGDVPLVVRRIHHVLSRRRAGARIPEMRPHGD